MGSSAYARAALARRRLLDFCLVTKPGYQASWHHRLIAKELEAVERGDIDRLMILMPPRHGKSEEASIRFPAWFLGRNPDRRVISCSYNAALSADFGRKARNLVDSPIYRAIFPEIKLSADSKAALSWDIMGSDDGGYIGAGVGGPITGRGGDILIIDDPIKNAEDADSITYREKIWEWYTSTAYTRLEKGGAIILILTHWHDDDLAGRLRKAEKDGGDKWHILSLPAIAEEDDEYRKEGEALWPGRFDLDALERIKVAVGSRFWTALYQQRPDIKGGAIFKREWWRFYRELPEYEHRVHSWDTGFKKGEENDPSVCLTMNKCEDGYYISNVFRERLEFPELRRQALARYDAESPDEVLIEDKASGQSLIQELQRDSALPIIPYKVDRDKVARANAASPMVEAGKVFLPESAPWVDDFITECAQFPVGTHDDQVDAMTQAIDRMKVGPPMVL